jgi:glycosyltransferase involved in cell wall biosynthesis
LIEQKNKGLGAARNVGLEQSAGDYVVFLDSDDMVSCDMCKTLKQTTNQKAMLDVVYYASSIVKETPIAVSEYEYVRSEKCLGRISSGFESLKELFPAYYQMSACMSAYRKKYLDDNKIRFVDGILFEDRYFSLRVITEAENVIYIPNQLYIRRFRSGSIVTTPGTKKKLEDVLYGHRLEWHYRENSEKWRKEKGLMQYYALASSFMALQKDVGAYDFNEGRDTYIIEFANKWFPFFDMKLMSMNELTFLLYVLDEIKERREILHSIDKFKSENDFLNYIDAVKIRLLEKCRDRLNEIPFNKNTCVAIYGIGKHTRCMLDLYRKEIGEIESDLYFIVSDVTEEMYYDGKEVRHIDDLKPETNYIIISSKLYQVEMYKKLEECSIQEGKIIRLYDEHDAVDYVIVSNILSP